MEWIEWIGTHFMGMFQAGGEQFVGLVTGIVPTLVVLLTFTNAIVRLIGEQRTNRALQFASRYILLRYTLMPILSLLILTSPMAFTMGRFLPEKQKPAFYDATVSFVHPVTSFFPYANAAELFVWLGIANGLQKAGYSIGPLAVHYFLVGIAVMLVRGVVTEIITEYLVRRMALKRPKNEARRTA